MKKDDYYSTTDCFAALQYIQSDRGSGKTRLNGQFNIRQPTDSLALPMGIALGNAINFNVLLTAIDATYFIYDDYSHR